MSEKEKVDEINKAKEEAAAADTAIPTLDSDLYHTESQKCHIYYSYCF